MKHYDSPIFGRLPKPSSVREVLQLVQRPMPGEPRTVRMWRGQGDIAWPIHSTAYRRLAIEPHASDALAPDQWLMDYEENLLRRATHRGFRYVNGRCLSDFELLARLQHHGAATRLVDATRNALIGLYFSAATHPNKVGILLGIHTHYVGGYESEPLEGQYRSIVEGLPGYIYPQTWQPSEVSPRVAAHHSQFLYSSISSNDTGSLFIDQSDGAFHKIAISPKLKRELLRVLSEIFDIRHVTLFPDIDGFGTANSYQIRPSDDYRW